ncbi:phenylacetic acid degradation protein PaaN [Actinocrinis puniceicyclus]|uniref:Phenylacetic acid degradation protein PaaN n=1 Tax=Actinocrinis puniceicyclus TaxID=977794 RepID=A0A8J7WM71_9ACTN|nr:phenylacetic acid degradation protein PaaN [Actinocrinis puniceicyclus]MBS2963858.1 phenylacetic acid degradation protein PaaN [Actinocrinis puniceicyclus]
MTGNAADLVARHRPTLDAALAAIRTRTFFSHFPEQVKAYPPERSAAAKSWFDAALGGRFPLEQPGTDGEVGGERSPYGFELGITYPHADIDALLPAMAAGIPAWQDAGAEVRAAVCTEILTQLNELSFEVSYAAMHTTGQAFGMAFQAAGPHAQDRGLEAVAYGYSALSTHVSQAVWEKPQGSRPPVRLVKKWVAAPRGIALVVGCNTFPTWNGYPGLFASLVTGNPVLVKPHPSAILPLALTVRAARRVLAQAGFDPNLVALAAEDPHEHLARTLALRPEVRLIDFTGSNEFGDWLERNAVQAQVFTEKAGVNTIVVDSFEPDQYTAALDHLAFSLSLYTAQMCTSPQNLLVPRGGVPVGGELKSFEQFGADLAAAVEKLLGDDARAAAVLGAVVNPFIVERLALAQGVGKTVLASRPVRHPEFPEATVRTPLIAAVDAADGSVYEHEWFGPVSFLIATDDTAHSIELYRRTVSQHGALTSAVYSTDEAVIAAAEEATWQAGANLSINLTGPVYMNQSAGFSDYHGTGLNPAANATYTDHAFVASRFRFVQSRRPA